MCFAPQWRPSFDSCTTSGGPKVARACGNFKHFYSKCAPRHNGVHFFDISTSKSRPRPTVFATTFFAPQRRALFRRLNLQKCSQPEVFCAFSLPEVLGDTTACTFSTSQLPKAVRTPGVLALFTSKCAWRHNGVHFFHISTSKSGPSMVCFVHFHFQCASRHNSVQFFDIAAS